MTAGPPAALKRRLGLALLIAYGVGVMVGAGIYVLVGAVAGSAGIWAPLSFAIAGLVALPTALSFAELTARIPEAAGEAAFVEAGLGSHRIAVLVGLAIVVSGAISAAAVLRGGAGYLTAILPVGQPAAILILGLPLVAVAVVGVLESLAFAALMTAVEVTGLILVAVAGFSAPASPDWLAAAPPVPAGVAAAAGLAFFAFIGFEDMVNMAEETRDPTRILPRGILAAVAITTVLYMAVSLAAVRSVPIAELGQSARPLSLVWERGSGHSPAVLSAIAVAAALNGILAQIVMAARVLYGLGRRSPAFAAFHESHPRFGTPLRATVLLGAAVIAAALMLPVAGLAGATSTILLAVFVLVNLALIRLKARWPDTPFRVPGFVPRAGFVLSLAALAANLAGFA